MAMRTLSSAPMVPRVQKRGFYAIGLRTMPCTQMENQSLLPSSTTNRLLCTYVSVLSTMTPAPYWIKQYQASSMKMILRIPSRSELGPFQEQLLACRMVHFAKEEIVWECRSRYRCECTQFDASRPRTSKDGWISGDTANMGVQWYSFVNEVCARQPTFATDIHPGRSGIAAQMEASMMGRYLAAL